MPQPSRGVDRPVLVAVDFSESSAAALCWGAEWAGRVGADLVVLHVVHDPAGDPGYYVDAQSAGRDDAATVVRTIADAAERMLGEFLDRVRSEHPELDALEESTPRLIVGTPVRRILEVADEIGAALVVVGSQGRTGLSHFMLGSTAERVARLSPVPVVIVKDPEIAGD